MLNLVNSLNLESNISKIKKLKKVLFIVFNNANISIIQKVNNHIMNIIITLAESLKNL